jgi:hypothetical protein
MRTDRHACRAANVKECKGAQYGKQRIHGDDAARDVRLDAPPENRTAPPSWLRPALDVESDDAWVGDPIPDPDSPGELVEASPSPSVGAENRAAARTG